MRAEERILFKCLTVHRKANPSAYEGTGLTKAEEDAMRDVLDAVAFELPNLYPIDRHVIQELAEARRECERLHREVEEAKHEADYYAEKVDGLQRRSATREQR